MTMLLLKLRVRVTYVQLHDALKVVCRRSGSGSRR